MIGNESVMSMKRVNCRNTNMCMFCKYWLGKEPDVDFVTGTTKYKSTKGLCKKDSTNGMHDSDSLCYKFEKSIVYL